MKSMKSMKSMTLAEAAAQGLLPGQAKTKTRKKKRTTQDALPRDGAETRCVTHDDERFTRDVDEDRHVNEHHGCRIETVTPPL